MSTVTTPYLRRFADVLQPLADGSSAGVLAQLEDGILTAVEIDRDTGPGRTHHHPSDQLIYVLSGSLSLEIGADVFRLQRNSLALVPAGASHRVLGGEDQTRRLEFTTPAPSLLAGIPLTMECERGSTPVFQATINQVDEASYKPLLPGLPFESQWLASRRNSSANCALLAVRCEAHTKPMPPHLHRFTQIYVIRSGSVEVRVAADQFVAERHDVVIIPPGVPHSAWACGDSPEEHLEIVVPEPQQPFPDGWLIPADAVLAGVGS
jgi:quercetin dioxygenase-like cupin family protein